MLLILGIALAAIFLTVLVVIGRDEDFRTLLAITLEDSAFRKLFAEKHQRKGEIEQATEEAARVTTECEVQVGPPPAALTVRSAALGK